MELGTFSLPCYSLSFTAHLGNVSCSPSHPFIFLGTSHSSIRVQQMWLLSQHTGLSSPHSSGDSGPGAVAASCGICEGVCSPPGCRVKPSSLGRVVSLCAQGERSVTATPGTCRVVLLMDKVTAFLQVFLPLPCSPPVSGSPAVLLIDTLRGI